MTHDDADFQVRLYTRVRVSERKQARDVIKRHASAQRHTSGRAIPLRADNERILGDGHIALLEHSMSTDIVIHAAQQQQVPDVGAIIAVSMSSRPATATGRFGDHDLEVQ